MSKRSARKQNAGEYLHHVAEMVGGKRITIAIAGNDLETELAVVKLALVLKNKPLTKFRAIMEDWDMEDIVRELY